MTKSLSLICTHTHKHTFAGLSHLNHLHIHVMCCITDNVCYIRTSHLCRVTQGSKALEENLVLMAVMEPGEILEYPAWRDLMVLLEKKYVECTHFSQKQQRQKSALMTCRFYSTRHNRISYSLPLSLTLFSILLQGQPGRKGEKGDSLEISVYMERFRVRVQEAV